MVSYGVFYDFKEFFLGGSRAYGKAVKELYHETGEAFESPGDADGGRDFDEDAFSGRDIDLKFAGFVDGGVEKGQQTL